MIIFGGRNSGQGQGCEKLQKLRKGRIYDSAEEKVRVRVETLLNHNEEKKRKSKRFSVSQPRLDLLYKRDHLLLIKVKLKRHY